MDFISWWWEDSPATLIFMALLVGGLAWMLVYYSQGNSRRSVSGNLWRMLFALIAVVAFIVGGAWLVITLQDWFAGNPVDLGRKVLGVPGYVFWMMSMMAILVRNSMTK